MSRGAENDKSGHEGLGREDGAGTKSKTREKTHGGGANR